MHAKSYAIAKWQHDHSFGQQHKKTGEGRTVIVVALTGTFMVVEIAAGSLFGSMALLADGLHMASHAAALGITLIAYVLARRLAHDRRFSFGSGKINALAGFTSAVLLISFAVWMTVESVTRFLAPVPISFDQAIAVAVLGLIVNAISVGILGGHGHGHGHDHANPHHHGHADHNLRAAYLHVMADALTSVLAICALLAGKFYGLVWMDPLMGIAGAILITRWSWTLLRQTGVILIDREAPDAVRDAINDAVESHADTVVSDLHVWSIGPGIYSAIISIVSHEPQAPDFYKNMLPKDMGLVHVTVETHRCPS